MRTRTLHSSYGPSPSRSTLRGRDRSLFARRVDAAQPTGTDPCQEPANPGDVLEAAQDAPEKPMQAGPARESSQDLFEACPDVIRVEADGLPQESAALGASGILQHPEAQRDVRRPRRTVGRR